MQRIHLFYDGHVQGVGFRFTAARIARAAAVVGFVRNLPDGRVELVAEGTLQQVRHVKVALSREMDGYIRRIEELDEAASGTFTAFDVTF